MEALLAHCAAVFSQHGGMFAVFFLGGLTGSLTHCLVMCGPTVACQAACGGGCGARFSAASQWHYHLGRFLTYGLLGFAAAGLSQHIASAPYWPRLSAAMMLAAGAAFLISAVRPTSHAPSAVVAHPFMRGVYMSFMPCGLIYAALMMAATLANPWQGMVAMMCFVLGTLPVLLLASSSAAVLAHQWRSLIGTIGRVGMACNGLSLLAVAATMTR